MKTPSVYAIVPVLSSQVGHCFQYHAAIQRALQSRGWSYTPLVPKKAQIPPNISSWKKILAYDESSSEKSIFFRLRVLFSNFFILRRFLRSLSKQSQSIIFIECFDVEHFASLFLALFFARPSIQIWVLHRYVFPRLKMKTVIFRSFHWWYEKMIGKENVRYLTDSELLAREQQKVYDRPFYVVPIPHTQDLQHLSKKQNEELFLWWPGGSIREEKGLGHIQRIAKMMDQKEAVQLIVAERARKFLSNHSRIKFIPTEISREEYVLWMQRADLILLPYSPINYAYRSSGVFVEAVSMGSIPVVTQGTWMAHELQKFDLDMLAIDWKQENLMELLWTLRSNQQIKKQLQKMRTAYCECHSEKNFGKVFAQIVNS